jgi:hypothetical protein
LSVSVLSSLFDLTTVHDQAPKRTFEDNEDLKVSLTGMTESQRDDQLHIANPHSIFNHTELYDESPL